MLKWSDILITENSSKLFILNNLKVELTKDKIVELKYYNPNGMNKDCKFNQTRDDIIKIEEIISEFFKSK